MKSTMINEVLSLLDPRPRVKVFRGVGGGLYTHEGKTLARHECEKIQARMRIFVNHKPLSREQA